MTSWHRPTCCWGFPEVNEVFCAQSFHLTPLGWHPKTHVFTPRVACAATNSQKTTASHCLAGLATADFQNFHSRRAKEKKKKRIVRSLIMPSVGTLPSPPCRPKLPGRQLKSSPGPECPGRGLLAYSPLIQPRLTTPPSVFKLLARLGFFPQKAAAKGHG